MTTKFGRLALASLILIAVSVALLATGSVPLSVGLAGILIIWLAALPSFAYLLEGNDSAAPFMPVAGLYYALFFGLPVFTIPFAYQMDGRVVLYYRIILDSPDARLVCLVAAGIGAMMLSFLIARSVARRALPHLRFPAADPDTRYIRMLYWLLVVASLCFRYSETLRSVPSVGQLLDPAGYLGLGGLYLLWRAGKLPRCQTALALIAVPFEIYWRIRYFFLTDLLWLPLFFALILWRNKQFKVLATIGAISVLAAVTYSLSITVRHENRDFSSKVSAAIDYFKQSAIARKAVVPHAHGAGDISYLPLISPLVNRTGQIWLFQYVDEQSPDQVPYWNGETYRPLLTSFIPRLVYPGKPEERAGEVFGYRYHISEVEKSGTSFNIPWITELLANFGRYGVVVGMAIFGLFLAVLDRLFNARDTTDLEFLVGLTIIFKLAYQESNFSVMAGSLLPLFVCFYLYFRYGPGLLRWFELIFARQRV